MSEFANIILATHSVTIAEEKPKEPLGKEGEAQAATIGENVVSVVANLSGRNREDVSNTIEFASRDANHRVKGEEPSEKWFDEYAASVGKLGWGIQSKGWSKVSTSGASTGTTFGEYIIEIVNADPGFDDAQKKIVKAAIDALTKAANHKGDLFRSFTANEDKSTFGVTCATVKNGALALRTAAFYIKGNQKITDVLLFKVKEQAIEVYQNTTDFFANQLTIDKNREEIEKKLAGATGDYISGAILD